MSFKDMAAKILGEKIETKEVKVLKEEVGVQINVEKELETNVERVVSEKSELNFVGSFNYVPDPIEHAEGSIYKNLSEGVAYIRKGLLWEELVRDGKPGRDAARAGGSGVGVTEVKKIIEDVRGGKAYMTGTLSSILSASNVAPHTVASPSDTTGTFLEMGTDGKWVGTLGSLPKATADALYASGALANLAIGVSCKDVNGTQYTYGGAGAGWVGLSQIEQYHPGDICIFGNSIIGQNGGGYALNLNSFYSSHGFCVLAAIRLNGRVRIVENLGVGGENSAGLVARINQLKQTPAGTVVVMESTNDATLGVSASAVFPSYLQIAAACASVGKKCVICTGIPRTTMTEAYKTFYAELRALILSNAGATYVACDTYQTILDTVTGAAIAGTLQDGVHPNSTGALLISSPLYETLRKLVPERDVMRYPVSLGRNKLAGQFFEGTGTSAPTGWSVQSAPSGGWSYVARPDSTGKMSAVASGDFVLNQNAAVTQPGRTIRAYLKMKVSQLNPAPSANSQQVSFVVQCYDGASLTEKAFPAYWDTGAGYGNLAIEGDLEFRSNPIEVPAGTVLVQMSISAGGGGGTYQLLHAYLGDDVE